MKQTQGPGWLLEPPPKPPRLLSQTHPSEPGLEGVLSDDRDETEATDRGRDEEGIVKDRTMDRGRLPLLSSRLEGWVGQRGEKQTERDSLDAVAKGAQPGTGRHLGPGGLSSPESRSKLSTLS